MLAATAPGDCDAAARPKPSSGAGGATSPNRSPPSSATAAALAAWAAKTSPDSARCAAAGSSKPAEPNMLATASEPDEGWAWVALPPTASEANSGTCDSGSQSAKPSRQT